MHKWRLLTIASVCGIGLTGPVWAGDPNAIAPPNDSQGCASLIQQGDANPPAPTSNLNTLQICMNSCDKMYASLGKTGRNADMLRGVSYCRKSLNNLYFASVAQTINSQLSIQTQQQSAMQQQSALSQMMKLLQEQQTQQQPQSAAQPLENPSDSDEPAATSQPQPQQQPLGPPDNVNW